MPLKSSARNRLPGTVTAIKRGDIVSQVEVRVGDNHIVSVITSEAVDDLQLREGDSVIVMVKSTEVMIGKGEGEARDT
jgi:molybdopterin-binding protein